MKRKLIICVIILMIVVISTVVFYICYKDYVKGELLYSSMFFYPLGSERVRIYELGTVEIDKEIEDPHHTVEFKKIKVLTAKQISALKDKMLENLSTDDMKNYINLLIHDDANYNLGLPID